MKPNEMSKPAIAALPRTTAGKDADGDEPLLPAPPPKMGFLPTGLSRSIVIGAVLIAAASVAIGLLGNRFTLITAARSENAIVYRVDRLTGQVSFCSPAACVPLQDKTETTK